jgi:hypothetical protein
MLGADAMPNRAHKLVKYAAVSHVVLPKSQHGNTEGPEFPID